MSVVQFGREFRAPCPQRDVVFRVREHLGQRGAPGTSTHHRRYDHGSKSSLRAPLFAQALIASRVRGRCWQDEHL